jgi:sterol desaturase/sphingolipid hydroxylase (fatty acid hydroxylase superfamily)
MENIITFFEHIPSAYRAGLLVAGIVLFWAIEGIIPLFSFKYNKPQHAGLNIFFTFTTAIINLFFAFLILKISDWTVANQVGVLYLVQLPTWAFMLVGLLVMDLVGAYFIHWLEHKVKIMWGFHVIHHTDQAVDVTTANRHHPGESVFRALFTCIAVAVTGSPMWLVMLYQTLSVAFSQFNHANINLPIWLDKWISWIIVSPNMHKIHHHDSLPYTDSNYGNIFAIWDRLFGTYKAMEVKKELHYGLDTYASQKEATDLMTLLKIPFQGYRSPAQYSKKNNS